MKVLFVTDWGTLGGATKALVGLTEDLKKRGVQIIICTGARSDLHDQLDSLGITYIISKHPLVMYVHSSFPFVWIRRKIMYTIRKYMAMHKIETSVDLTKVDLIHTNSARSDIGIFLSRKYNIPHIVHLREFGKEDYNCEYLYHNYPIILNNTTSTFIAVSNAVKNKWVKEGISKDKIQVVYDGVKQVPYVHADRNDNIIRFVICGGICEAKGQLEAVMAVKSLIDKGICNIELHIVGWSDKLYLDRINKYIDDNELSDYIFFEGKVDDVYMILSTMDVGLMCSRSEGFGLVTAEYMQAGLGVIASDSGANPELIIDNDTGLLYEKGNIESLTSKMELFINDIDLLHKCGQNAKGYAVQYFTANRNAEEIIKVYKKIIEF